MITLAFDGVAAVGNVHMQGCRQGFVLGMQTTIAVVAPLHFLQKQ